jgi:hypothetical protein
MRVDSHFQSHKFLAIHPHNFNPLCSICFQPVPLESAKTEEHGLPVHENCYFIKLKLERATNPVATTPPVPDSYDVQTFEMHNVRLGGRK